MKKTLYLVVLLLLFTFLCVPAFAQTTTTVLMYMCGTDLQEFCVQDIYEMGSGNTSSNINIVVQAGGATQWDDTDLVPNQINRFVVADQSWYNMEVLPAKSMGEQKTLKEFLDYGVSAFPADRYVLVLWNHGGGAQSGICFDETADFDSLTLHETENALRDFTLSRPNFKFDIIGMDACLMASYEWALHLSNYAEYMVASQELEPGGGWNYEGWLSKLSKDPAMDTLSLAVHIADSFISASLEQNPDDYLSMSVVHLPQMAYLNQTMETYSAYLLEALQNNQLNTLSRARKRMYSFGSFADSSSDMVDLSAFIEGTAQFAPNTANEVKKAYQNAVKYNVGTDKFDYLTGLSILFPYDTIEDFANDMSTYQCDIMYPNYSKFVQEYAFMMTSSDYVFSADTPAQMTGEDIACDFLTGELQSTSYFPLGTFTAVESEIVGSDYQTEDAASTTLEGIEGVVVGSISPQEMDTPVLDNENEYACVTTLSQDELNNLSTVEGLLYLDCSDEEDIIYVEMGAMQNAYINWENGEVLSGFDGTWAFLGEQMVTLYDQLVTPSVRRSVLPVIRNGVSGFLVISFTKNHPNGVVSGFTEGIDTHGIPMRGTIRLQPGDTITPTYPMLYMNENEEFVDSTFEGDPIIVDENSSIPFEFISLEGSESTYLYCFRMTDIYGEEQLSEFIEFYL